MVCLYKLTGQQMCTSTLNCTLHACAYIQNTYLHGYVCICTHVHMCAYMHVLD